MRWAGVPYDYAMANPEVTPRGRAAFKLAVLARDISDAARDLVADIATPHAPGELVYRVRHQLRLATIPAVDLAILIEAFDGTPWEVLAEATRLPVDELRARYEPVLDMWRAGVDEAPAGAAVYGPAIPALMADADPVGTAAALDEWVARAHDPRDDAEAHPVTRALTS